MSANIENSDLNYISKLKALEKVDFLKFNSNSRIFNEVIKNSEYNRNLIRKSVDLSYLIKPKQENNLFQFKMYLKESSVKPFNFLKTSKSSLFSINQNIAKTIDELNIIKRRNNESERIQNKSCSLNNHFNLNKGDSIGRNFHKSCRMKDTIGKESTSKIGFLSEVEKTLELKIFNTKKTSFKPPNFENNKLFIALGKSTFLKKKLN